MTFTPLTLCGLLVLSLLPLTASASAQTPTGQRPTPAGTKTTGLTLQAFQARHEKKMLAADTDGDGRVSRAEFLAAATARKGDPAKHFARLDRNGDGYLDKAEIDAALARRFKRLDTNGDGIVTAQERAAAKTGAGKAATDS